MLLAHHIGCRVDDRWLWRRLDLRLAAGEQLALRGRSGSGKSLLLRALAGLDEVHEGDVVFLERSLNDWPMPRYRAQVGYLAQRPGLFEGSVEDNLRRPFGLAVHRGRHYRREVVLAELERLGRDQRFLGLAADTLSGGEAQILALLRTLQLDPDVLLLDEATASLDPDTVLAVEGIVGRWLAGARARACIWTSHDPRQLERVCSSALDLDDCAGA